METIKLIQFLLKEKGLKISGVKKMLDNKNSETIDQNINNSINSIDLKKNKKIRDKLNNIKKILKDLNKYK